MQVRLGNPQKTISVHRLVAKAFLPNPLQLPEVNHIDGDKTNNAASNLEWTTHQQNIRHAINTGLQRMLRGDQHGMSKLRDEFIPSIRRDSRTLKAIAEDYGVSLSTIGLIKRGRIWRHVPD